ncbi:MAG: RNA polymerase factor sigma-54 [Xanthobacteraceae bacterium]|nr:RNA polymerase factor sigma-54 [Xanthobacteraceae bacterium]
MALSQKLQLRQSQALVMTPQLMQAIKLLQLSSLDLAAYVEAELERNPLLERVDEPARSAEEAAAEAGTPAAESEESAEPASEDARTEDWSEQPEASRTETEERPDTNLENAFPDDAGEPTARAVQAETPGYSEWAGVGRGGSGGEDYNPEAFVSVETTLAEHLARQLTLAITDPVQRMIGQHLIDLVDEAGYVRGDLAAIAEKLGAPLPEIEAVLAILQIFDPPGVCARDLAECLAIQLKERDRYDPAMREFILHLDLLAKRDFAGLKRLCRVDEEDLEDMTGEIRRLNPKPGLAFGGGVVQPIVPDVFVRAYPDGTWTVELNSDTLPRVLVSQSYYAKISKTAKSDKERSFLTECLQTANWLTRALDQRARTILKVATEIVRQQDAFLAYGVQHLRPLNLRMIADAIGMHESTVSRVTANKYMATPRGIFELKYFFSSAIAAAGGGEAHSSEAVRHRIKEMIDAESPAAVLSDDTIVQRLHEAGVDIARRTVAKYRESMRIPSSVQRRREKQASNLAD